MNHTKCKLSQNGTIFSKDLESIQNRSLKSWALEHRSTGGGGHRSTHCGIKGVFAKSVGQWFFLDFKRQTHQ